ncbi:MAG: T9SS type A sorting domain-containing protein [Chitinophagaceae bacterium]
MKSFVLAFLLVLTGIAMYGQTVPAVIFNPLLQQTDSSILHISDFTVSQKDNKAFLRWRTDSLPGEESFYAIERSSNGIDFTPVGISKNIKGGWFEFLDDAPSKGRVFYRIKLTEGQTTYFSPMIAAGPSIDFNCKFYPNPVDKVLIIKSESNVDVQIADASGKPVLSEKLQGGLKVLDVSALEPGIYVITLFQKDANKIVTDKLVKK